MKHQSSFSLSPNAPGACSPRYALSLTMTVFLLKVLLFPIKTCLKPKAAREEARGTEQSGGGGPLGKGGGGSGSASAVLDLSRRRTTTMTTSRRRRRSWITSCHGSCWWHGMQWSCVSPAWNTGLQEKVPSRSFSRPSSFLDPSGGNRQTRSLCFSLLQGC